MKPHCYIFICLLCLLTASCDMLESSPYDVNITGERNLTDHNVELIETAMAGRKSFRFAMISDTQRAYDDTFDAIRSINLRDDIDFVVHGGDMTEYGSTREFLWHRDLLTRLNVPYVAVIGNHDCLGSGLEAFGILYGPLNYAFTAGNVRFLCLNTNALEFDHATPVPDFGFIKRELSSLTDDVEKTIVLMHAGPFSEQFDNNVADEFHALLSQFPRLQFCLYGHGHHLSADNFFGDGVIYYQCPNAAKRTYLIFTVNEDDTYDYEVVEY